MSAYLRHFSVVGDDLDQLSTWEWKEEDGRRTPEVIIKVDTVPGPLTFREMMRKLFHSNTFQIVVVCFVILDALFTIGLMLMDFKVIHPDKDDIAPKVLHYLSFLIVTLFLMEVAFKLFAYRLEFFHHTFEVLDVIVVIISFALDITVLVEERDFGGLGFLILLRLWRVARIINGILISFKKRSRRLPLKQSNLQNTPKIQQLERS
ncbi:voltage-gated hydrogen channel 1-like [Hemicordylus capensis]|uniref:voltage-gated hydrogen channel 1-like n=1 Tax=Hemicordylus capensis TaxID=884348 RepID=UPI002302CF07|nr:voltage-gated hydrogen channel 1-like [Hemicordylus capensis]